MSEPVAPPPPEPAWNRPAERSVWDHPRPPALERVELRVRAMLGEAVLADTTSAWRVLETSHPPVYYIPPADIAMDRLRQAAGASSFCEWKGQAVYWDAEADGRAVPRIAWSYPQPVARFAQLKNHLAFYPSKLTACYVGPEQATAQEGDFYGGWITSWVKGPFKGGPGTMGW